MATLYAQSQATISTAPAPISGSVFIYSAYIDIKSLLNLSAWASGVLSLRRPRHAAGTSGAPWAAAAAGEK